MIDDIGDIPVVNGDGSFLLDDASIGCHKSVPSAAKLSNDMLFRIVHLIF